ncbi:lantibiotic dehydratase [Actinosynnema sp. NPDC050436]|uniref:lantibiotic dehydratase n=1 Tax=Actinosynnema sp. NPDC050436 TaxID=3155659 RepID=UPI0033EBC501
MNGHLVPLGTTGWSVWRDAVLRSTGFPVDRLDGTTAPGAAEAADAFLAGGDEAAFDAEFERALAAGSAVCRELAADPALREAVTWQSTAALAALDGLLRADPDEPRRNKRRERERLVVRYWQRYCAKNETIGFFGPAAWATVDPDAPPLTTRPGPGLLRARAVRFEHWALTAVARRLAEDPAVRRWLPPARHPHLTVDEAGRRVLRPVQPPLPLAPADLAALVRCDGRRPAGSVIADLVDGGVVRTADDGHLLLERLADRGLLSWHGDLPQGPGAEDALHALVAGIGDPQARERARADLARLTTARDAVASAAGDPDRLAQALAGLDAEFTAVTGRSPRRREGRTYAGRALCFEDTARDVEVVVGGRLLADLAAPLALLLGAARWLTAELADAYGAALRELYDDLAGDQDEVRLADLWYLAQGPLFGTGDRPVDAVAREFAARWATLFGLDDPTPRHTDAGPAEAVRAGAGRGDAGPAGAGAAGVGAGPAGAGSGDAGRGGAGSGDAGRGGAGSSGVGANGAGSGRCGPLHFAAGDLASAAAAAFPADRPGWSAGRLHSPDLQLCAADVAAVERGDYLVVLGELHTAWPTFDCAVFTQWHPDPAALARHLADDLGGHRVRPLHPVDWPRYSGRVAHTLDGPGDRQLGIGPAPGGDPDRLLPATSVVVTPDLVARAPDGRTWPLLEVFSALLAIHAVDGFKLVHGRPHSPRITVDKLVVARETWRTTVADTGLADVVGERERYLAVRRWRRALGLPDRVFVKLGTEVKPVFADLTSPLHAASLCTMVAGAARVDRAAAVTVSEVLPDVGEHWLTDAEGRRYSSELRLHLVDPEAAR